MFNLKAYGIIGAGIGSLLLIIGIYHNVVVSGLEDTITLYEKQIVNDQEKIADITLRLGAVRSSVVGLKGSIVIQNANAKAVAVEYDKAIVELKEWQDKPVEVRYKDVYVYIKDIYTSKEGCDVTNDTIDAISNIYFNALQRM